MYLYQDLVNKLINKYDQTQYLGENRTGVKTVSIFGHQMRFDLQAGFPLLGLKNTPLRLVAGELLWMLSGSTNDNDLRRISKVPDDRPTIWSAWATPVYTETGRILLSPRERLDLYVEKMQKDDPDTRRLFLEAYEGPNHEAGMVFMDEEGVPRHRSFGVPAGELGPIYQACWRRWATQSGTPIDQIAILVDNLRKNPFSRRHVVSAWNPEWLPDESKSPQENVIDGKAALASCHCLFQMHVEERSDGLRYLSCQLYQRSSDVGLGVPMNIAFYSLLTHLLAQVCGFKVGDFIWTSGDTHLYANQIEPMRAILARDPRPLPTLVLNPEVKDLFAFEMDDIGIEGYDPYPAIRMDVAV